MNPFLARPLAIACAGILVVSTVATPVLQAQSSAAGSESDTLMVQRIREEGLLRSRVLEYASALADGIGPRLTGSPNLKKANEWTRDQLTAMGCSNAHLEDWGEFGMGWQQLNVWTRMTAPDTAVLITQATPWSPATKGPVAGQATLVDIKTEKDLASYKGKLKGKVVLMGDLRAVPPADQPLFQRYSDADLKALEGYRFASGQHDAMEKAMQERLERRKLQEKAAALFFEEGVAAVILPSRDGRLGGGSGGTLFDDNGAALGRWPYKAAHAIKVPVLVAAIESYGRVYRLLKANVPVSLELNVETRFTGDQEHGYNTVAEIPGTDPQLKEQLVMVGGHLDSWASGTGATDNAAGTAVALEVMRILKSLNVQPRRTIRIALWTGEEQGIFGSQGYARQHFGGQATSTDPEELEKPELARKGVGPLVLKPEQKLVSGYFNVDNGTGRIRGVYLQGNSLVAPLFAQWIAPLKDLGVTTLSMRDTGGTDHLSFDAVGIPGFQFIQDPMDYETRTHHSNADTFEHLQGDDLKQAATVEAIFVYLTAMQDRMLPRKPVPAPEQQQQLEKPLPGVMPGAVEPTPVPNTAAKGSPAA